MRIACLITAGAFLLSIAIAEGDVGIGTTGQYHHQRLPRPIILEPVVKLKSESSPIDWFFKMMSRVMNPPKKPPPPMIGPINLPGMAGQVYIRQLENNLPWESSHVVIKMMMRDPVTGMNVPLDSGQTNYRPEESSQRYSKPAYGSGTNNYTPRPNNPVQGGFLPSPSMNQYQSWQSRQRPQRYPYNQPFRASTPNELRHDDYTKNQAQVYSKDNQDEYNYRRFPPNNYNSYGNNQQENYERFRPMPTSNRDSLGTTISSQPSMYRSVSSRAPNDPVYGNDYNDPRHMDSLQKPQSDDFYSAKPDSPRSTQIPYPEYRGRELDQFEPKYTNQTQSNENYPLNNYRDSSRYRQFVRKDRMVASNNRNYHDDFGPRERNNFRGSNPSQASRGFREPSPTKFDLEDVGGLEVITAPNLNTGWNEPNGIDKNKDTSGKSRESDLNQGEDSISMGNGKNLARGESAEHINEEQNESPNSRMLQARLTSYKIIDRSHRSQGSQNMSSTSENEFQVLERMRDKKNNSYEYGSKLQNSQELVEDNERMEPRIGNVTGEVIRKVMNLTASNRWRFQEGRRPSRIVKAIYRRKPIGEILKGNGEIDGRVHSSETNSTDRSSMDS